MKHYGTERDSVLFYDKMDGACAPSGVERGRGKIYINIPEGMRFFGQGRARSLFTGRSIAGEIKAKLKRKSGRADFYHTFSFAAFGTGCYDSKILFPVFFMSLLQNREQ